MSQSYGHLRNIGKLWLKCSVDCAWSALHLDPTHVFRRHRGTSKWRNTLEPLLPTCAQVAPSVFGAQCSRCHSPMTATVVLLEDGNYYSHVIWQIDLLERSVR